MRARLVGLVLLASTTAAAAPAIEARSAPAGAWSGLRGDPGATGAVEALPRTPRITARLRAPSRRVGAPAVLPSGAFALALADGSLFVVGPDGKAEPPIALDGPPATGPLVVGLGEVAVPLSDGAVARVELASRRVVVSRRLARSFVGATAWVTAGGGLSFAADDQWLTVPVDGSEVTRVPLGGSPVLAVSSGERAVIGLELGALAVHRLGASARPVSLGELPLPRSTFLAARGDALFVQASGKLSRRDLRTGATTHLALPADALGPPTVALDGDVIVEQRGGLLVRLHPDGTEAFRVSLPGPEVAAIGALVDRDGRVAVARRGEVVVIADGAVVSSAPTCSEPLLLAGAAGRLLLVCEGDEVLVLGG